MSEEAPYHYRHEGRWDALYPYDPLSIEQRVLEGFSFHIRDRIHNAAFVNVLTTDEERIAHLREHFLPTLDLEEARQARKEHTRTE